LQTYIAALAESPLGRRQAELLDRIIARPELHARMLNTLSRLEYVGVRKMLKSRDADGLDLDGLQHILDETIHALRLKKAALALAAGGPHAVETYGARDTLAGDAGEDYIQGVDRAAEAALADLSEQRRGEVNYLLTSAAIEVRAQAFYPLYEGRLRAAGVNVSVAAIMRDEDRHLAEMATRLDAALPGWRGRLETVLAAEAALFARFVDALDSAAAGLPAAPAVAVSSARS
jgi:hypothetical protein